MKYIRIKMDKIEVLKKEVFEMDSEAFQLAVAEDAIFGIWMNKMYEALGGLPKMQEEYVRRYYALHVKNLAAHPKRYLTDLKFIIWN